MTKRIQFTGGACQDAPLPKPTKAWFGNRVMKWGRDPEAAAERRDTITRQELEADLVTIEIAERWRECYCKEYLRTNFANHNALYRAALMDRAVELLGGPSTIRQYLESLIF